MPTVAEHMLDFKNTERERERTSQRASNTKMATELGAGPVRNHTKSAFDSFQRSFHVLNA